MVAKPLLMRERTFRMESRFANMSKVARALNHTTPSRPINGYGSLYYWRGPTLQIELV